MPCAPAFIAVWTARFIARRNDTRPGELVGDALRDQRRVELGLLDLLDVEVDLRVAGDLGEVGTQPVGFGAAPADHDAGARGVDVDAEPVTGPLDLDAAHRGALELLAQVVADLPVLDEAVRVLLALGEPTGLPVGGDPEPESVRVDLLAHVIRPCRRNCPPPSRRLAARRSASSAAVLGVVASSASLSSVAAASWPAPSWPAPSSHVAFFAGRLLRGRLLRRRRFFVVRLVGPVELLGFVDSSVLVESSSASSASASSSCSCS